MFADGVGITDDEARGGHDVGSVRRVRDFAAPDQAPVRDLVLRGLRERWGDTFDESFNTDLDDIARTYVAKGAEVVVHEVGPRIVAVGLLLPADQSGRGRIVRMSVDSGHRRAGHGRRVVEELIVRARRQLMHEILVFTDTPWTSAVALYRACGFVEIGRDDADTYLLLEL